MRIDRRTFVAGGVAGALTSTSAIAGVAEPPLGPALSTFVAAYMAARDAPGMVVGMADAKGWSDTTSYGVADLGTRRAIRPDERFHIGSITKSFTALMILQLVEEGKVRLDADITTYLPDLPLRTPFGRVTVHHLLCHASGVPSDPAAPGWPNQSVEQAFAPGTRFHYCNLGYAWLGQIVAARGGETWAQALHRRILDPLGMSRTSALIGAGMRRFEVPSYVRREDDRPYPRHGALTRAAPQTFVAASGCIASTAGDMNRYIAMLVRRGAGPKSRLLSPDSFALMTGRHIAAAELGAQAGYGYGWMIDRVDSHDVIRHTGGMESFMSSIHVDLEAGVGAFASINAQQNYRPVPVTAYVLGLYRARSTGSAVPKPPSSDPDGGLKLADYTGEYGTGDGGTASVTSAAGRLQIVIGGRRLALESLGDDKFVCLDPRYRLFTFLFRREVPLSQAVEGKPNPVLAIDWARDSYVRRGAQAPVVAEPDKATLSASQLSDYEGFYAADGGWLRSARVMVRAGRLWVDTFDGVAPLESLGSDRFRFADEPANPETLAFSPGSVSPRTLSISGIAMVRLGEPFMELA